MGTYYKVFSDSWAKEFSKKTAERLLNTLYKNGELYHTEEIKGFSEDYIFLAKGLIALFEITQEKNWLDISLELVEKVIQKFRDKKEEGFLIRMKKKKDF